MDINPMAWYRVPMAIFYGTTLYGGFNTTACLGVCGTIFKPTPQGTLATHYTFCSQTNCADAFGPQPGLIQPATATSMAPLLAEQYSKSPPPGNTPFFTS
jgi:hypothetical protein